MKTLKKILKEGFQKLLAEASPDQNPLYNFNSYGYPSDSSAGTYNRQIGQYSLSAIPDPDGTWEVAVFGPDNIAQIPGLEKWFYPDMPDEPARGLSREEVSAIESAIMQHAQQGGSAQGKSSWTPQQ